MRADEPVSRPRTWCFCSPAFVVQFLLAPLSISKRCHLMLDLPTLPQEQPYRAWQFSLRGLFLLTLSVAIGLSYWKMIHQWYPSTLAAISFWIVLGLTAQVRDIWRSSRHDGNLARDDRWNRRFAVVWRLAICVLIVASLLIQLLVAWQVLSQGSMESLAIYSYSAVMWDAVFLVSIMVAVGSSPRLLRENRRSWTWIVNLLGIIAACVFLVFRVMDCLCVVMLVHVTIEMMLSALPAHLTTEMLVGCTLAGKERFFDLTLASLVAMLVSCSLLWLLSRRWRKSAWQRACLVVLFVGSLAATILLTARVVLVEVPRITPVLAAHIRMPVPTQLTAAAVLMLIVATVIARRWSRTPDGASYGHEVWRRDEKRYYHEWRLLQAILGGVSLLWFFLAAIRLLDISSLGSLRWADWSAIGYLIAVPQGCLPLALAILAIQGVFSGRRKRQDVVTAEQPSLSPGLFAIVWTAILTSLVCSAPLLGAWGLALWFQRG
jgi:hypothetical protein